MLTKTLTPLEEMCENLIIDWVELRFYTDWAITSDYCHESGNVRVKVSEYYDAPSREVYQEWPLKELITADVLATVRKICKDKETYPDALGWVRCLREGLKDPQNADWDAECADCVIQILLLGDIVYG